MSWRPVNVERIKERAAWYVNRARIMPAPEYGLRAIRTGAQQLERVRLASGWVPGQNVRLSATRPFFSADSLPDDYLNRFPPDTAALTRLLDGELEFFGKKLSLGNPVNWHRDPSTGTVSPLSYGKTINYRDERNCGDIKVLWEVSRHQHLVPMAVAFAVTGDPRYRDAVMAQIDSWVEQNPYGLGVHWCSSLEVALRAIAWTMVHSLFAVRLGESGMLSCSRNRPALEQTIYQHGYFIEHLLSRYSSANNHLIGELVGLYALAGVFGFDGASERWEQMARTELETEAERQVSADGVSREQAFHYHLEVLEYLLFAWCIGAANGKPLADSVLQTIRKMTEFVALVHPGCDLPPRIGDSDEATINRLTPSDPSDPYSDITRAVRSVLNPGHAPCTEKAFWYSAICPGSVVPVVETPAAERVVGLPEAGYSVVRDRRLHLIFDAGPLGYPAMAAHGHADALSFCLAINGKWWLVDPGTYTYHREHDARDYFRGTPAHNTLTVNGRDQSQIGGPFMWVKQANAQMGEPVEEGAIVRLWGEHDGYERFGVRHRRELLLDRKADALEITDHVQLASGRETTLELNFHFAPDVAVTLENCTANATRAGSADSIRMDLDRNWAWRLYRASEAPMAGWYSPKLGEKVPAWTLRGTRIARASQTAATRLTVTADG